MEHSEVDDLVFGLGYVFNNDELNDVKVFVGKERKIFFVSSFIGFKINFLEKCFLEKDK